MNLMAMFGGRYAVTLEVPCPAETPENRVELEDDSDSWRYLEIKGKRGMVYPYSEIQIAVVLPTRSARRLMKLMGPELVLLQHADDAMCYKAAAEHAGTIVRFIKPKSLRQLTETHKAVLSARLATHRCKRGQTLTQIPACNANVVPVLPGAELRPLGEPPDGNSYEETAVKELFRRKFSMVQNGTAYGHRPDAPSGAGVHDSAGKRTL